MSTHIHRAVVSKPPPASAPRNMFYPWHFTPGNAYSLDSIEDTEAKTRLKDVVARKAPRVQIGSGPDAPDHVHMDVK